MAAFASSGHHMPLYAKPRIQLVWHEQLPQIIGLSCRHEAGWVAGPCEYARLFTRAARRDAADTAWQIRTMANQWPKMPLSRILRSRKPRTVFEDRSGRQRSHNRHRARRYHVSREGRQGMAEGRRRERWAAIPPVAKGGRLGIVKADAERIGLPYAFGSRVDPGADTEAACRGRPCAYWRFSANHAEVQGVLQPYAPAGTPRPTAAFSPPSDERHRKAMRS